MTAQEVLACNVLLCQGSNKKVLLSKPDALLNMVGQLSSNLSWFSLAEKASYMGMQIIKQRPFGSLNRATAAAIVMTILKKTNVKPDVVVDILESSSVVDEVAAKLTRL